jgi:uncharacterized membrane protein
MTLVVTYAVTLALFVVVDLLWLTVMAGRVYRPTLGDIALSGVDLAPAAAFYVIYPIGVMIFAVAPARQRRSLSAALLYGALFGFFCYATYDLTNQATLRHWTLQLTVIDVAWGCVLTAIAAATGYGTASRIGAAA